MIEQFDTFRENVSTKIEKSDYLDFAEQMFIKCFRSKGYIEENAVNITSQVDRSVDFIGSKISTLKHYVIEEDFGEIGRFIIQNSMKLKALKSIRVAEPQKFGSYYKCMGLVAKPEIERVVYDTFDYFANFLCIPFEDMCIKICSLDYDLMSAIKVVDSRVNIEVDKNSIEHYRHRYGMDKEQITGRDFNIGIKKLGTDSFFTCATFVLMESPEKKMAIDMGIGNCSLSMCKFGTSSTVSSSRMADIIEIDSVEKEKFADALIAVSVLLKEDVKNHISHHFRKKYRQYLNALLFWNERFNYSKEELVNFILIFLSKEYSADFSSMKDTYLNALINNSTSE